MIIRSQVQLYTFCFMYVHFGKVGIIHSMADRKRDEIKLECITSVSQSFPSALLCRKIYAGRVSHIRASFTNEITTTGGNRRFQGVGSTCASLGMYNTHSREYFGHVICVEDFPLELVLDGAGMAPLCLVIMLFSQLARIQVTACNYTYLDWCSLGNFNM
jgi:hypothetical protein